MKTRLIKNLLGVLAVVVTFTSCSLSDDTQQNCSQVIGVSTVAVSGPTTATVNEEITLTVSYRVAEECGDFYAFNTQAISGTEKQITALVLYDVCNCDNTENTNVNEPYKFKASVAGTYTLKFFKTEDTFVTHTVTVE
ncbi:hypothetical protein J2X31_001697 [Flavobacterium arsenatis]|uniref:GOLD domain-containing protein n=1 Tax=Flavobacterium arsenatis TaxID=1484332 RepID=A0ABU1TNZ9_9FLAO|nr:hypothetical protein [Flavobacterium arsenatis]MDR6967685.1 hypothetical protein [Flavobacterium arsenatis]